MIRASVTLTAPPFSSAPPTIPSRDGVAFRPDGRQIRVSIPGRD